MCAPFGGAYQEKGSIPNALALVKYAKAIAKSVKARKERISTAAFSLFGITSTLFLVDRNSCAEHAQTPHVYEAFSPFHLACKSLDTSFVLRLREPGFLTPRFPRV